MADEIELPQLVVKTDKSQFRLRCHAAAWADEYGGNVTIHRRYKRDFPGLLLLSATGPDTAVKSVRATLYQPDVVASSSSTATRQQMLKARATFDGKPVTYHAAVMKLAPGVIHLVALASIPGLMPNMSDDHLVDRIVEPTLHHAALAGLDSLAEASDGRKRRHRRRQGLRVYRGRAENRTRRTGCSGWSGVKEATCVWWRRIQPSTQEPFR